MSRTSKRVLAVAVGLVAWGLILGVWLLPAVWRRSQAADCSLCPRSGKDPGRGSEDGFVRQGPPKPGEWRWRYPEPEQTFEQYSVGPVNRRCGHRTTFYLQPLGEASTRYRGVLERIRAHSEAYFGVPAKILDPVPMVADALEPERKQYHATRIIRHLADRLPPDALVSMGITDRDLYSEGLNFVFGEGSLHQRCGVYSLRRFETDDAPLFLRRTLKLVSHEAGHILSIEHCAVWSCVMQGANTLEEHDGHPMHLCPVDLRKILWNVGIDGDERYRNLRRLYGDWGLEAEAGWIARRLGHP
ncbi:MAG TPA: archaemetzincin [Planctomycetota bacterium]|nr:archaemetzincin [Planctomycetota bacterium]